MKCGKQIENDSNYCRFCGKPTHSVSLEDAKTIISDFELRMSKIEVPEMTREKKPEFYVIFDDEEGTIRSFAKIEAYLLPIVKYVIAIVYTEYESSSSSGIYYHAHCTGLFNNQLRQIKEIPISEDYSIFDYRFSWTYRDTAFYCKSSGDPVIYKESPSVKSLTELLSNLNGEKK